jgi:hypothetical protein
MKCDTFRRAVEALDLDATVATFSPSIVLRSPVLDESLEGRQACSPSSFESSRTSDLSAHIPPAMGRKFYISCGVWVTGKVKAST